MINTMDYSTMGVSAYGTPSTHGTGAYYSHNPACLNVNSTTHTEPSIGLYSLSHPVSVQNTHTVHSPSGIIIMSFDLLTNWSRGLDHGWVIFVFRVKFQVPVILLKNEKFICLIGTNIWYQDKYPPDKYLPDIYPPLKKD